MWTLNHKNRTNVILEKFNRVQISTIKRAKKTPISRSSQESVRNVDNLLSSILKTFWAQMLFCGFLKLIASFLMFVNPLVLDILISFMSPTNDEPTWRGYFYASLMFISPMFESLINNQFEYSQFNQYENQVLHYISYL